MSRLITKDSALLVLSVVLAAAGAWFASFSLGWAFAVVGLLGVVICVLIVITARRLLGAVRRIGDGTIAKLAELDTAIKRVQPDHRELQREQAITAGTVTLVAETVAAHGDVLDALTASVHRLEALTESLRVLESEGDDKLAALDSASAELHRQLRSTDWAVRRLRPDLLTDIQAMQQLLARFSPKAPLPAVGGWALSPTGLLALVDVVERYKVRRIVELGSGTSTLWLALALQAAGAGTVISIDHESRFAEATSALLDRHGLSEWAEVRHAPLVDTSTRQGIFSWYDVDPASIGPGIDLLVVDGPPNTVGRLARYPALSVLASSLSRPALILADDTERADEREMLALWRSEYPGLSEVPIAAPGTTLLALDSPERA